jgi:hypothetical protein
MKLLSIDSLNSEIPHSLILAFYSRHSDRISAKLSLLSFQNHLEAAVFLQWWWMKILGKDCLPSELSIHDKTMSVYYPCVFPANICK